MRLEVFDVLGRKVRTLVDGEEQPAGRWEIAFEAGSLAGGVYFYRLRTGDVVKTQRLVLVQ